MIRKLVFVFTWLVMAAGLPLRAGEGEEDRPAEVKAQCTTAIEVIERNLEAVGGREKIRTIESLIIEGELEGVDPPPRRKVTLYAKKPDRLRQEGLFSVTVFNGKGFVNESKGMPVPLTESDEDELRYRIGFIHNSFTLLKWEPLFSKAELKGIKRYGPVEQYVILFPDGQNGHDFVAYIDSETFLIDRIVFLIRHAKAKTLKVVNRLREYQRFEGIMMPTFIIYDRVGWKALPSQFQVRRVTVNPGLEDALFESPEIRLGFATRDGNRLNCEVMGKTEEGYLLTNARDDDLSALAIHDHERVRLDVAGRTVEVTYLQTIQAGAGKIDRNEIYLCRYPGLDYPRLILISLAKNVEQEIPCRVCDALVLSRLDTKTQEERNPNQGENNE
ncbi:MAG: hypothetical protein ABIK28_16960 [Planctomycetota bacterium]